jgi:hypothetical protein
MDLSDELDAEILRQRSWQPERRPYRQGRERPPDRCKDCGRPFRGKDEPKRPGTVVHAGRGRCATDYARHMD